MRILLTGNHPYAGQYADLPVRDGKISATTFSEMKVPMVLVTLEDGGECYVTANQIKLADLSSVIPLPSTLLDE